MMKQGRTIRRKPRLTDEQITEIMRLKRQGKSISAIARAIGCHRQTVRLHLREKHGDIVAEEVRKQVLVEELRRHFEELASFAAVDFKWRLRASHSEWPAVTGLEVPTTGPISVAGVLGLPGPGSSTHKYNEWVRMYAPGQRKSHLTQALREHVGDSVLWEHWDSWRKEVADYETASTKLIRWIMDNTEAQRFEKIDPENMESIQRYLIGNILRMTSGEGREELEIRGREITAPGVREVVVMAADSGSSPQQREYLYGILREAEQLPEWAALQSTTSELRSKEKQSKLRDIIIGEIDPALSGIELMRAFPGHCHLCPV